MNFETILRTPFLTEHLRWQLLFFEIFIVVPNTSPNLLYFNQHQSEKIMFSWSNAYEVVVIISFSYRDALENKFKLDFHIKLIYGYTEGFRRF